MAGGDDNWSRKIQEKPYGFGGGIHYSAPVRLPLYAQGLNKNKVALAFRVKVSIFLYYLGTQMTLKRSFVPIINAKCL